LQPSLHTRFLKAADGVAGRAAYRALVRRAQRTSALRDAVPPSAAATVRRVLVIRPGGIGDAVLCHPMLRALRRAWPDAAVDVLAERRNAGIFRANDAADRVLEYDSLRGANLVTALRGDYDVVVDTEQFHHLSAVVAHLVGARISCGFDTHGRGGLYTHPVPYDDERYEVRSFLDLARAVTGEDAPFDPEAPFFPLRDALLDDVRRRHGLGRGAGVVAIQPGASIERKRWDPDRFRELAQRLCALGHRVVLVGGRAERRASDRIAGSLPPAQVRDLCGRICLAETAAVVSLCDLLVGSDTGVLHIAYGVGTPTVNLFGPGVASKWAPRGSSHRSIRRDLPCSPCMRFGRVPRCPYDAKCMRLISVDEVFDAVRTVACPS
jgi:lipopolysaccharide heptosyltransferase II